MGENLREDGEPLQKPPISNVKDQTTKIIEQIPLLTPYAPPKKPLWYLLLVIQSGFGLFFAYDAPGALAPYFGRSSSAH